MNTTLSTRQIQLFGLLAVIIVAIGGYVVMTHKSSTSTTTPAVTTPATSTPAQTTATPGTSHAHTATPPAKLDTHGLPVPVARALQKHAVVVVSVTDPRGAGDQVDRAEAQAGAAAGGAGYVSIDVFHQRPGTAILRKLGVVDTPAVLIVKRPGTINSEFKGFVDRAVVAQAVADAR